MGYRIENAMQQPFPALTDLLLVSAALVDPDLFLGGSSPSLRFTLCYIPIPGLPKLILIVGMFLIPGRFYPKLWSLALSVLAMLEVLEIGFESTWSCPDRRQLPPSTRTHWFDG
jgi:hypothetical protein